MNAGPNEGDVYHMTLKGHHSEDDQMSRSESPALNPPSLMDSIAEMEAFRSHVSLIPRNSNDGPQARAGSMGIPKWGPHLIAV